ncbi:hypothetical protein BH24DEI2_BH24DEI2_10940 [soil metagenome]
MTPLFGAPKQVITINLRSDTDVFNAFANPVPRPQLGVRALFPLGGNVGFRAADPLLLLLLHELTHLGQLTYTELPEGAAAAPKFRLVGENVARVPPAWFIEGIAVWVESRYTNGGRLTDAGTKGVLETLALSDAWPSLTDAGLGAYDPWPGGMTRYLLGAGFVDYLVDEHGFEAILKTLRAYNAGGFLGTFSSAWNTAVGTFLADEWETWRQEVEVSAQARADTLQDENVLTETGWYTGSPAVSPDGTRLAWVTWPPGIRVADVTVMDDEVTLTDERTVMRERRPETLEWLDSHTLLYNRTVRKPGSQVLELFTFDLETRQETQLTAGARAHFPAPDPAGCILYVQDDAGTGSSLWSWCDGVETQRWMAPAGEHITGLSVSYGGHIALGLWREGFADIALLDGDEVTYLTQDAAQDVSPAWQDEDTLLFSSDRGEAGVFEVYRLELGTSRLSQQTHTLGGAFSPVLLSEHLLYTRLSAKGYDLALGKLEPTAPTFSLMKETPPEVAESQQTFETRRYSPWPSLVPYGWLPLAISPSLDVSASSLAATVLGQDDSGEHSYAFTVGYAGALDGPLGGFHADLSYSYRANSVLNGLLPAYPLGFGVRLGTWPHAPHLLPVTEIATGLEASVDLTLPLDRWTLRGRLEGGPLYMRSYGAWQADASLGVVLGNGRADDWGYRTRGLGFGVTSVLSATPTGPSFGLWGDGNAYRSLNFLGISGTGELALRAGYRQAPPIPLFLQPWAGVATGGYRVTLPAQLRYGDGLYALERVTVEPRVRGWFDGGFGVGGDVSVNADLLLNYAAPVSFGVTVGYAQGFWYRLGARVGL